MKIIKDNSEEIWLRLSMKNHLNEFVIGAKKLNFETRVRG